jgi:hypothetical protein
MDFNSITKACLLAFDALRNDPESAAVVQFLDEAESDDELKEALRNAAFRLDVVNPAAATQVRELAKGFAF